MLHKSVDDVLSLYRTKEGLLYVGTTSGLVCLNSNGKQMKATYIGREQGLLNDMIHGVLEDENGLLWLGTNRGLIKYNPINGSSHAYFYSAGVQIGEFSDDAYYMCPYTQELFFGGIDGLLYLDKEVQAAPEFYPDILLRKLTVGHTQVVQGDGDYYTDDGKALQLKGTEVSFALSFVVPDFLSGEDIEYSYQLEGYDKDWTSFSSINEASYTGVPAGDYIFKVRYKRDVFDTEYRHFSIPVYILSPWYRSVAAYLVYLIIFLLLLGYVIYLLRKNYLQERMMKTLMGTESCRKSETVYTNRRMLEDFTLIYNYCDQLRAENLSYEQCLEKVSLIRETVMNALLNPDALFLEELKQFFPDRFIVSARMSIQGVSQEVLRTLEEQGIDHSSISSMIPEHLTFPVYKNALYSILYCCYLRITEMKGTHGVIVEMSEQDGKMQLHFSSKDATAKALYEYLSDKASSVTDSDHVFAVHLLLGFVRSALERIHAVLRYDDESGSRLTIIFEPAVLTVAGEQGKKTVLLLEDRDEMTWLISNFLADEYVVHQVKSVQLAFDEIRRSAPALLLVDMTMYANAESTFMEYVSRNRTLLSKTAFIPLLTWKVGSAIQRELILWSDSYIVLPYDILFLREVVHNAIYGKREAKQIYMEELGDLAGQIVCTTTEQADFIRKLLKVIEENLDKEELGSTLIADRMAMSSRQFYRKFKEISNTAPGDLIKSYRMEKAARLLLSVADQYKGNNNFEYDLVDVVRQSLADKGNVLLEEISQSYDRKDRDSFGKQTQQFLELILAQDSLLSTRKEFSASSWLNAARSLGTTEEEKKLYEWNASALITVWGDSIAANQGGLHDYSHREWSGILKDLYYQRWKTFFEQKQRELDGKLGESAEEPINFYGMEKAWAEKNKTADSSDHKLQNVIETAKSVYRTAIEAK